MKGLIAAALAVSLLGSTDALAQSAKTSMIGKISGQKFTAADGSSLTFLAYHGGMAREMHTATGATFIETYALKNSAAGTVSDTEAGTPAGTFRLTSASLTAEFKDGSSEMLAPNGAGGMRLMLRSASGELTCTAWYPAGHRFSDAEREAALIDVSADPALNESGTPSSCAPETVREAGAGAHRDTAQSGGTVVARLPE